jgi:hypothetical protein
VTVRTADAVLVGSAVDVAVMIAVPGLFVAVTTPVVALTVATVASEELNVFAVFVVPVTFAVNVTDPPISTVCVGGAIVIAIGPPVVPPLTVMTDDAVLVGSATEAAVMIAMPFFCVAVTRPVDETVATVASDVEYVTAVFVAPETAATSCSVLPADSGAELGVSEMTTFCVTAFTKTWAAAWADGRNFDVAMIVAVPGATAVTTPALVTVATAVFDDENVTPLFAPVVSSATLVTKVVV